MGKTGGETGGCGLDARVGRGLEGSRVLIFLLDPQEPSGGLDRNLYVVIRRVHPHDFRGLGSRFVPGQGRRHGACRQVLRPWCGGGLSPLDRLPPSQTHIHARTSHVLYSTMLRPWWTRGPQARESSSQGLAGGPTQHARATAEGAWGGTVRVWGGGARGGGKGGMGEGGGGGTTAGGACTEVGCHGSLTQH